MQNIQGMGDGGDHGTRFTLIEMIVVLGIIAVLAAMLMPVLAGIRAGARSTACRGNLRQTGLAHTAYQDDHYGNVLHHRNKGNYGSWINYLHVDMGFPGDIFQCPAASVHFRPYSGEHAASEYKNLGIRASYIMNIVREDYVDGNDGDWKIRGWQDENQAEYGVNAARVRKPDSTIFITEIPDTFRHLDPGLRIPHATEGIRYLGHPDGWEYEGEGTEWDDSQADEWVNSDTDHGIPIIEDKYKMRRQVGDHHHGGFNALMGGGSVRHMLRSTPSMWIAYEQ